MFITFEGCDGSGKTTLIELITKFLVEEGFDILKTREPGGIDISEQIREIILSKKNIKMDARTEALLYAAARRQHIVEKIIPALKENKIVICDRFVDSSMVYQGVARQIGVEEVFIINKFAIEDCMPDVTFYLDITPEVGLERIKQSGVRTEDRLDAESLSFHQKVRGAYLELVEKFPERIIMINGERTITEVFDDVVERLRKILT